MHSEEGGCVDSAVQTDGKRKQSEVGEKEVVVSRTTSAATLPGCCAIKLCFAVGANVTMLAWLFALSVKMLGCSFLQNDAAFSF